MTYLKAGYNNAFALLRVNPIFLPSNYVLLNRNISKAANRYTKICQSFLK